MYRVSILLPSMAWYGRASWNYFAGIGQINFAWHKECKFFWGGGDSLYLYSSSVKKKEIALLNCWRMACEVTARGSMSGSHDPFQRPNSAKREKRACPRFPSHVK